MPQIKIFEYSENNQINQKLENKKSLGDNTVAVAYKVIPVRYRFPEGKIENFIFELGKMKANRGIVKKTIGNNTKIKINASFNGTNEQDFAQMDVLKRIRMNLVEFIIANDIISGLNLENSIIPAKEYFYIPDFFFKPSKEESGGRTIIENAPFIMSLRLDEFQGVIKTKFIMPDGSPTGLVIPADKLYDKCIEFIPSIHFKGICISGGKNVLQCVIKSAIITSLTNAGEEFNQDEALSEYSSNLEEIAVRKAQYEALFGAQAQSQTAGEVLSNISTGLPSLSKVTDTPNLADSMQAVTANVPDRSQAQMFNIPTMQSQTQPLPSMPTMQSQTYQTQPLPTMPTIQTMPQIIVPQQLPQQFSQM